MPNCNSIVLKHTPLSFYFVQQAMPKIGAYQLNTRILKILIMNNISYKIFTYKHCIVVLVEICLLKFQYFRSLKYTLFVSVCLSRYKNK